MTLVELVITISIILLIATIYFPKVNIEKYQVNSFTKQLCSDIRYVRNLNKMGNTNTYIYLNKNDEIIVIPPPLNIEKLINEIENSKNTGFYLKLEYNILNEFFKTVADRYDWEIIRTDKDALIAKIIKRK